MTPKEQDAQCQVGVECGDYLIVNDVMKGQSLLDPDGEQILHFPDTCPLSDLTRDQVILIGDAFMAGLAKGRGQGKQMQLDELHYIYSRIVHGPMTRS